MTLDFPRLTTKDLAGLGEKKELNLFGDFNAVKTARQLVYNHKRVYLGSDFDTTNAIKSSKSDGLYCLIIKRISFGRTVSGEWEPGTPEKWKREHEHETENS